MHLTPKVFPMRKFLVLLLPLLMMSLAACETDAVMWGACDTTEYGTDGTYVLACQDGVWTPIMTVGEYMAFLRGEPLTIAPLPVRDTVAPVVTVPADIEASATSAAGAVVRFTATATDDVLGPVGVICAPSSGSTFALGETEVACRANDLSGNRSTESFTVSVMDTTAPNLFLPEAISVEATSTDGATVTFAATATDNVDEDVAVICDAESGDTFEFGETTVACSATDAADNATEGSFTVTVADTIAPVLSLPTDIEAAAVDADGAVVEFSATATDAVDGSRKVSCEPPSGSLFGLGDTTVTCSATDRSDNTTEASFTVTVADTTAPDLYLPFPLTIEATGPDGAVAGFELSAYDNVDGSVDVFCDAESGATFAIGETTVECFASDEAGNNASGSFTVTVEDTTDPELTMPRDVTVEATGPAGATVTFAPSATDIVDGEIDVTCTRLTGETFAIGETLVECAAIDAAGNESTGSFTVTVEDTTAPELTVPDDVTVEATSFEGAEVEFSVTATDLVGELSIECSDESGDTFELGETTVECEVTDSAGNSDSGSFTVTVEDTTNPVLEVLEDVTVEATGPSGAAVEFSATATDIADPRVSVECTSESGGTFAIGSTVVGCTATDDSDNTDDDYFVVTVVDETAPSFVLPEIEPVEATSADGAEVEFTVTASDIVDGDVEVSCDAESGDTFAIGRTEVSCSASDSRDNTADALFFIIVEDTTAPKLTVSEDVTVEATGPDGAEATFDPTPSATDIVDGSVDVSCDAESGDTFPVGETTVTCSVTDEAGNEAEESFTVTVEDTTAPELTVSEDLTVEATGPDGAIVGGTENTDQGSELLRAPDPVTFASAEDIVDGTVEAICDAEPGDTFALGETTVNCSATDEAGNESTGSFTVTVEDTTAPELTVPEDVTTEATGFGGAVVEFAATATDAVDEDVEVSCDPESGDTFPVGETTVECTATDDSGNSDSGSFTVTVTDTTNPVLGALPDLGAEATGPSGASVEFTATATDIADENVAVDCTSESGATFPIGLTAVGCTATDDGGNIDEDYFVIVVTDETSPSFEVPDMEPVEATSADGAAVSFSVTASDLVDGDVEVSCDAESGATFAIGDTEVECSASDSRDNTSTASFFVIVRDTTAPSLSLPHHIVAEATGPDGASVEFSTSADDIVDGAVEVSCDPGSGATFAIGDTTVLCTATDVAGNEAVGSFTVTVQDTTAPELSVPGDLVVEATGPDGAIVEFSATATDLVDGDVPVYCYPSSGDLFPVGFTFVSCDAYDFSGNGAFGGFVVEVTSSPA